MRTKDLLCLQLGDHLSAVVSIALDTENWPQVSIAPHPADTHTRSPRTPGFFFCPPSHFACCKRPGVVRPLTPVGSTQNTLLMKRARAVLSRTQVPSTASSNASGTDFHHNTVWDTVALGSAAGLTNDQSNKHSVAR